MLPTSGCQCKEENRRVEEMMYPHTYNPNMALNISLSQTPVSSRAKRSTRAAARQHAGGHSQLENMPPAAAPAASQSVLTPSTIAAARVER